MAGKDKHPPLDPRRWSTNKRVKPPAKGDAAGASAKVASGAKTARPGENRLSSPRIAGELDKIYKRRKEAAAAAEETKTRVLAAAATNEKRQAMLQKALEARRKGGVITLDGGLVMHMLQRFSGQTT